MSSWITVVRLVVSYLPTICELKATGTSSCVLTVWGSWSLLCYSSSVQSFAHGI